MTRLLLCAATALASSAAFAQDPSADPAPTEGRPVKYRERTEIEFEKDLDVHGELVKPAGVLTLERRKQQFDSLVRLREEWNDEMRTSVDSVR
jgi:hypothetical protein